MVNPSKKKVAIVQARMRSQRLPNKMLAHISGRPLLEHVVSRARASVLIDEVVVATTTSEEDDKIEAFCRDKKVVCFRGSEDDVLDRYYQVVLKVGAEVVVRITGDCPMIDPQVIDLMVERYNTSGCDYASNLGWLDSEGNFIGRTFPDGLDVEVFSAAVLRKTWQEAQLSSEREHVTPYIYKNSDAFVIEHVSQGEDLSRLRWTVDEQEDLELVRKVYERLYSPERHFTTEDVLNLLRNEPDIGVSNDNFSINEGYRTSLDKDVISKPQRRSSDRA